MKHLYLTVCAILMVALQSYAQLQVVVSAVSHASCSGSCDGTATAIATGGTPPYSYVWTPDSNTEATATGLCAGTYSVLVTDDMGAIGTATVTINEPAPIFINGSVDPVACSGDSSETGSISIVVTGGATPYTFQWSTGETTSSILAPIAGIYTVIVVDANGCSATSTFTVAQLGTAVAIEVVGGDPCDGPTDLQAVVTGGSGNYSYAWSTGDTTATISVSDSSVVQVTVTDEGLGCTVMATAYMPTFDEQTHTFISGWLNRGFCRMLWPVVVNGSCQPYTGPVSIAMGFGVDFGNITPTPDDVSGGTATWNNITIAPGASFVPQVNVCVPLSMTCGDDVPVVITANGTSETHLVPILCSYDPNDKQVSPAGVGEEGIITGTEELTYTVRFQNTGTAPATFIHILDELDADLDLFSLRVLASSHAMELSIEDNVLDFFFDDINLPDSTSDPAGSQGFVTYAIDMLPDLEQGTVIENTAEIYFDFNDPIITNTTVNTIDHTLGISSGASQKDELLVYPNPSSGLVTVSHPGQLGFTVQLYSTMGQLIMSGQSTTSSLSMDVSDLPSGMYLLTSQNGEGVRSARLVKY